MLVPMLLLGIASCYGGAYVVFRGVAPQWCRVSATTVPVGGIAWHRWDSPGAAECGVYSAGWPLYIGPVLPAGAYHTGNTGTMEGLSVL